MMYQEKQPSRQPNLGNSQPSQRQRIAPAAPVEEVKQPASVSRISDGVAAKPVAASAVPQVNNSKSRPRDDLDDLEDMLEDMEGGSDDDIDQLFNEIGASSRQPEKQSTVPKGQRKFRLEDDLAAESGMTKPNNGGSHHGDVMDEWDQAL